MEQSIKNIKPLTDLKEALSLLRDTMTTLAENKVKELSNIKEEFNGLIVIAQQMDAERIALDKLDKLKEDLNNETKRLAKETNETINRYL
jgi:hypothetical protein